MAHDTPNLAGKRFGRLTVVEISVVRHYDEGRNWRCICTCGGWAIRTTAMLLSSLRRGSECMCRTCHQEMLRRQHAERHADFKTVKPMGRRAQESYAPGLFYAASRRLELLEALVEAFGPIDEESFRDDEVDPSFYSR